MELSEAGSLLSQKSQQCNPGFSRHQPALLLAEASTFTTIIPSEIMFFSERELPVAFHQNQRRWARQGGRVRSASAGSVAGSRAEQRTSSWGCLSGPPAQAGYRVCWARRVCSWQCFCSLPLGGGQKTCAWRLAVTICSRVMQWFPLSKGKREERAEKLLYKVKLHLLK